MGIMKDHGLSTDGRMARIEIQSADLDADFRISQIVDSGSMRRTHLFRI